MRSTSARTASEANLKDNLAAILTGVSQTDKELARALTRADVTLGRHRFQLKIHIHCVAE